MQSRHSVWACATIMVFAFCTHAQADGDGAVESIKTVEGKILLSGYSRQLLC